MLPCSQKLGKWEHSITLGIHIHIRIRICILGADCIESCRPIDARSMEALEAAAKSDLYPANPSSFAYAPK